MNTIKKSESELYWDVRSPTGCELPVLVLVIPDFVYGLLPYCGPGTRFDAWNRERVFLEDTCRFLQSIGCTTLSLEFLSDDTKPPKEHSLVQACSEAFVSEVIQEALGKTGYSLNNVIFFGHGFGLHTLLSCARSGITPAGYILAAGVYSDIDEVLKQKYQLHKLIEENSPSGYHKSFDPETCVISTHINTILNAIRSEKSYIRLLEGDIYLEINLPKGSFPIGLSLLEQLTAPVLILHGTGDLDIPVQGAYSVYNKNMKGCSVNRSILPDCDHWFRKMPIEKGLCVAQRCNGSCINNPNENRFYQELAGFIWNCIRKSAQKKTKPILPMHV